MSKITQTSLGHLTKLHQVIKRLMKDISACEEKRLGVLLAALEYKVRTCKHCIETRLAVKN